MSARHEFTPATVVSIPGGRTTRKRLAGGPSSASPLSGDADTPSRDHRPAGLSGRLHGPAQAPSPDQHGFDGPPDAAKAADTVGVGTVSAGVIAAVGLAVPAFWISLVLAIALGSSLPAALLTAWSIGTLAALAIPVCVLLGAFERVEPRHPGTERVARPVQPRRNRSPLP